MNRFERLDTVNRTQPVSDDDNIFLQITADAGRRYGNSPGADPALLGARDVIMGFVENRMKDLEARIERRLDEITSRTAATPTRRSLGITWERFKVMDAAEQKAAVDALSPHQFVMLFHGKVAENLQVLEARLLKLEDALNAERLEASLSEDGE